MKGRYLWIGVIGWFCVLLTQASVGSPQDLGSHAFWPNQDNVWRDASGQATIVDAERAFQMDQRPLFKQEFWQPSVVWWHVHLTASAIQSGSGYLEIVSDVRDDLDVYVIDPEGDIKNQWHGGAKFNFDDRPVRYRLPVLPVAWGQDAYVDVYMRFAGQRAGLAANKLTVWPTSQFMAYSHQDDILYGLYYGIVGAIFLYNLFLFLSIREKALGWYVLYVGLFLLWNVSLRGFAAEYLWPSSPVWNRYAGGIFELACMIAFIGFSRNYLELKRYRPDWLSWSLSLQGLCGVAALALLLQPIVSLVVPGIMLGLMISFILYGSAFYLLIARHARVAKYYLLAFTMLAVAIPVYDLRLLGWIHATFLSDVLLQVGSALEMLLLAFGLADRIKMLNSRLVEQQEHFTRHESAISQKLEQKYEERTRELERTNQELSSLAMTDDLTGIYNRRFFNEALRLECQRRRRLPQPLTFCMLDVDYFKSYNDRYGHQRGDEILMNLARILGGQLRRATDRLFRLGGEEFGLLLEIDQGEKARDFVDQLRQSVQDAGFEHAGSPIGCVTISMGVLHLSATAVAMTPEELYAATDALLYVAKARGRNTVEAQWK